MEPQLCTVEGQPVAVGLTWEIGDKPQSVNKIRFGSKGQGYVSFSGCIAEARNPDLIGIVPLAALVGTLLANETDVLAAIMPLDEGTYWAAQFKDGAVLVDSEELFDNVQSVLEWATQAKRSNAVDEIYLPDGFIETTRAKDVGLDPQLLQSLFAPSIDLFKDAPVFEPYHVLTPKGIFVTGTAVCLLGFAVFSVNTLIKSINAQAKLLEIVQPVEMDHFAVDGGSFASACTTALSEEWPGVPGWEVSSIGCALQGSAIPIGDGQSAIVWKEFKRGERYASILGSEVTSARMAEYMLRDWPHLKQIEEGRIIVGHRLETEWTPFISPQTDVALSTQIENAFIAVLEKTPQGRTFSVGRGFAVNARSQTQEVRLSASLEAVLSLAKAAPEIEINTIVFENNVSNALISQTKSRFSKPVDDTAEGQSSNGEPIE